MLRIIKIVLIVLVFLPVYANSQNAELVYHETNITIRKGKLYKSLMFEIKINNRDGDRYNEISIPYSSLYKISGVEAHLENERGEIIKKLKKDGITDKSAISNTSLYEDSFVKKFSLKHNTYPYSIIYKYQIVQDEYIFIDYWRPIIDIRIPTRKAVLKVEVPEEYQLHFWEQLVDDPIIAQSGSNVTYTWYASHVDVFNPEVFSPPVNNFVPVVAIVPLFFNYDITGNYYDWSSFGDWEYELIQGLFDLPPGEKNEILLVIRDEQDDLQKIKKLYYYLQDNTRYINVAIETGGLKPYPASYVATNKFGDCKALTIYFKSILDFIGVQSFYTSIYAGGAVSKIHKEFPSQQFNHVILCVPQQSDTLWLDCTSDGPFNYIGSFIQNRDVFVVEISNSHFTKTPSLSFNEVLETRTASIKMDLSWDATAEFNNTYRGKSYEILHSITHSFGKTDKSQIVRNNFIEDGFDIIDFNIIEPSRDSSKIHLEYLAKSNTIINQYGNDVLMNILPFSIPKFREPKYRKMPVQLDYPIYKIDTIKYLVPETYSLSGELSGHEIVSDFGHFGIEYLQNNNEIFVIKSLYIKPGYYFDESYIEFYNFINEVDLFENNSRILLAKKP